jgi:hypothetical protein
MCVTKIENLKSKIEKHIYIMGGEGGVGKMCSKIGHRFACNRINKKNLAKVKLSDMKIFFVIF